MFTVSSTGEVSPQRTQQPPAFEQVKEQAGTLLHDNRSKVDEVIAKALEINDRPVVVEFIVHKDAMVWPMVPAGVSNDEIRVARDMAPEWDEEIL